MRVAGDPAEVELVEHVVEVALELRQNTGLAEHHRGAGIAQDPEQPLGAARRGRMDARDGHEPGRQAAEQAGDDVEAVVVEQDDPVARRRKPGERPPDGASVGLELPGRDRALPALAVLEEGVEHHVGLVCRPEAQCVDQGVPPPIDEIGGRYGIAGSRAGHRRSSQRGNGAGGTVGAALGRARRSTLRSAAASGQDQSVMPWAVRGRASDAT